MYRFYTWWGKPFLSLTKKPKQFLRAVGIFAGALRHRRFLATMPRAGTNFLYALLSAADEVDHTGGNPKYEYAIDPDSQRGKWKFPQENRVPNNLLHFQTRLLRGEFENLSRRFFVLSHFPAVRWVTLFPPAWMRPVVLIRHPLKAARSLFGFFHESTDEKTHRHFLQNRFEMIPRFLNYWGAIANGNSDNSLLILRYEELVDEPAATVSRINKHWNLEHSIEALHTAERACRRKHMVQKVPKDRRSGNKRVSVNKRRIPVSLREAYVDRARSTIKSPFGYELAQEALAD